MGSSVAVARVWRPDPGQDYLPIPPSDLLHCLKMEYPLVTSETTTHRCPIRYQNNLWSAIHGKDYKRVVYLTDRWTDCIWYHFSLPRWGEFVAEVFRSCLQTLLYTSVLNKEVVLDNGLKIDLTSLDGSTSFYWA